jgi:large subunit ribosomal protein L18
MSKINHNISLTDKRKLRVRSKISGTAERPRVSIHRSNKHTSLQAINDDKGVTLASAHDMKAKAGQTKTERAEAAATALAGSLKKQSVTKVVIDRGSHRYHGRIRAVAEQLRAAGLEV